MNVSVARLQRKKVASASTLPPLPVTGPTPEERDALRSTHPIHRWTDDFILPTPSLLNTVDYTIERIDHGAGSTAYVGTSQFGKSTAIRYLQKHLQEAFPLLPVFEIEFPPRRGSSELDFLAIVLGGIDAHLPLSWPIDQRRRQLIMELALRAAAHPLRWIVLILDEVQHLDQVSLAWLKYIIGRLGKLGVRVIVFSFGQQELVGLLAKLKSMHKDHLLKRFFLEVYRFDGIRSAAGLRKIFELLDWSMRYPDPITGWSFTQFYFPEAFAAGWRLADDARTAFDAIRGEGPPVEFGMDGVRDVTQAYFRQNAHHDCPTWHGASDKQWQRAVAAAPALHV